ncbi:kinesin, putative [Bodo saltans]|uniref:Kinesin, putative n=1 Tax=Bodo saltans TaxID=75058 RepID=A0A0S4KPM5_BODSA|nr:kinesin, putative [Bodo saltans]|eukprot:CUI15516.1 kinesin, putative [Bodo saltans]
MLSPNVARGPDALSISRVNSRAASRDPAHAGQTADPVLARYLSIKRELDRVGSGTNHVGDQGALGGLTPRTPRSAGVVTNNTAVDARSILSSPGAGVLPQGWNHRLNDRYEARMSRQRDVLREVRDPHPSSSLETSAVLPAHDSSSFASHHRPHHTSQRGEVEQLALAMADSEAARVRAEQLATQREQEITHLRKRLLLTDGEPHHYQAPKGADTSRLATPSNSPKPKRPQGNDVLRVPEVQEADRRQQLVTRGRLEALERALNEKDERLDAEVQRAQAHERRSHELGRQVETLQLALQEHREHLRAGSSVEDASTKEAMRLRQALEVSQRQIQDERRRSLTWEKDHDDHALEIELLQDRHREEMRELSKRLREAELRQESADAARAQMEEELLDARRQHESRGRDVDALEHRLKDATVKLESLKSTSAQESIVKDELKYEVERFKKVVSNLRDELTTQEDAKRHLESALADSRSELEAKALLQVQLREAEQRSSTLSLKVDALESSLVGTSKHLADAREDLKKLAQLEDQMAALRAALQGKDLTIEKHHVTEADLTREVERLKVAVKEVNAREEFVVEELRSTQQRLVLEEQKVSEKESTLKQLGDVMSTYEKLRQNIDEKSRFIAQQQAVMDDLRVKNNELDSDVETLLGVKRQIDELAIERQKLLGELAQGESDRDDLLRQNRSLEESIRGKQKEIYDVKELVTLQDDKLRQAEAQLSDMLRLDAELKHTRQELHSAVDSLQKEAFKRDELQSRLDTREERLSEALHRTNALEEQITQLHRELTQAQVDVGRMSVVIETNGKERTRLEKEIDTKKELVEQVTQELSVTRKDLQQAKMELQALTLRERLEGERSSSVVQQAQLAGEECERLKLTIRRLESELQGKEEQLFTARQVSDRHRELTAQFDDARQLLHKKDDELRDLQYQLKRTLEAEAQRESGAQAASRLESRYSMLKQQYDKLEQSQKILEQEEASKQRLILEQEREMHRLKDRLASQISEGDSDKARRRALEERIRELELECQRTSALDGQVAGLNLVISQRNKDLEEERALVSELRGKLRSTQTTHAPMSRSNSPSTSINAEAESRLLIAEESLRQCREELRRSQERCELLQRELASSEGRREALRVDIQRLTIDKEREVGDLAMKCERAQRLADDLLSQQKSQQQRATSINSDELSRARSALERSEAERNRIQGELHDKGVELEIASENLSTLQTRLREQQGANNSVVRARASTPSQERTIHIGASGFEAESAPSSSHAHFRASSTSASASAHWDVNAAEETIQQWRERRRQHQEQERSAQAAYQEQVRSRLP